MLMGWARPVSGTDAQMRHQVAPEIACTTSRNGDLMGKNVHGKLASLCRWIVRHDFAIVIVLSLTHIGLSCLHSRESVALNPFH